MAGDHGGGASITPNAIVQNVVGDPNQLPNATVVVGLVGESPVDGCIRVYTNTELNSFVEIARADVLHQQPFPEETGLGGSYLFIRRDAEVTVTRTQSQKMEAEFLRGPIASSYKAGALPAFQAKATRAAKLAVTDWFCWSGEQWLWCTGAWYKDCTDSTQRKTKKHVTEHVRCKKSCRLTF